MRSGFPGATDHRVAETSLRDVQKPPVYYVSVISIGFRAMITCVLKLNFVFIISINKITNNNKTMLLIIDEEQEDNELLITTQNKH